MTIPTATRSAISRASFARRTGLVYVCLALIGGFAFVGLSEVVLVRGDAAATARSWEANAQLFRFALAASLVTVMLDVLLA